ncbi:inner membrane-spanning protein YciB [Acuticoccus mangrovi]|uniref:Septation protein IspZ n=1 Tax=Acuticoccus mangrovi TaxID=2796142 RepID=A0A934MI15_9HYPH|nr:septation protein IspZ [Acuticoccus mangrovi]MBJ3776696.1 septation protein IspZ [Acuticoccus mangrovi]
MKKDSAWDCVNKRKLLERFAVEIGPALVFVAALQVTGITGATISFIAATALVTVYSFVEKRHLPVVPAATLALAALFGGLTILFDDPEFIQFRPTLVNACGALAIIICLLFGHLVLKQSLEDGFRLSEGAWWTLSLRMALYLAAMAFANEVVRHTFSTETWAWFKAVSPLFNGLFLLVNWPLIRDNLSADEPLPMMESPPAGPKSALNPTVKIA